MEGPLPIFRFSETSKNWGGKVNFKSTNGPTDHNKIKWENYSMIISLAIWKSGWEPNWQGADFKTDFIKRIVTFYRERTPKKIQCPLLSSTQLSTGHTMTPGI